MKVAVAFLGKRGGGGRYTLELARALAKQPAIDVHLLVAAESALRDEFAQLGLSLLPLHTYRSAADYLIRSLLFARRECRNVYDYLKHERIDVLIMGMIHPWSPLVIRAARRAGARVITVAHEPQPHLGDPLTIRIIMRRCIRYCLRNSDGIVALTRSSAQVIGSRYPAVRVRVIPHGAFVYHAQTHPRSLPQDRPIRLLFFGRIVPYKGLGVFLEAARLLQIQRRNLEIEIWGDGDLTSVETKLREVSNVRIENRWVEEHEVSDIFHRNDICVLPYLQASQSGIVGIAQAAGLPIVAFPVQGLVEQLATGGGVFTRESNATALAEALIFLISDPHHYSTTSREALAGAHANSWPTIAARFADFASSSYADRKAGQI
jgi:glycosyltransferase involved in cell wall biosynthesis